LQKKKETGGKVGEECHPSFDLGREGFEAAPDSKERGRGAKEVYPCSVVFIPAELGSVIPILRKEEESADGGENRRRRRKGRCRSVKSGEEFKTKEKETKESTLLSFQGKIISGEEEHASEKKKRRQTHHLLTGCWCEGSVSASGRKENNS